MPYLDCSAICESIILTKFQEPCWVGIIYDPDDSPSVSYVQSLVKTGTQINVKFAFFAYKKDMRSKLILEQIDEWNERKDIVGILFLSPDKHHYKCCEAILLEKRVEGNDHDDNINRISCTARACAFIAEKTTGIAGKSFLIVGYGKTVGKPLAYLLMRKHAASVTLTHRYTDEIPLFYSHIHQAEVIISAVGRAHFIRDFKQTHFSSHLFIDAGITSIKGKICGDVHPDLAEKNDVTPVPGGVGPITTALVMQNIKLAAAGAF